MVLKPRHPEPEPKWRHNSGKPHEGYHHWPFLYRVQDAWWIYVTSAETVLAKFLRIVSGVSITNGTVSRPPDSMIGLDGYSLSIDHQWSRYAPDRIAALARELPQLVAWAWGPEAVEALKDPNWLRALIPPRKGFYDDRTYPGQLWPAYRWLAAGWFEIARHPAVIQVWVREGVVSKLRSAIDYARKHFGVATEREVLLVARAMNSFGVSGFADKFEAYRGRHGSPLADLRAFYVGRYDQPERYDWIYGMSSSERRVTNAELDPVRALRWDRPPARPEGFGVPRFLSPGLESLAAYQSGGARGGGLFGLFMGALSLWSLLR